MRDNGDIDGEHYQALRRHVLWGTPLPELLEGDVPTGTDAPERPPESESAPPAESEPEPAQ